MFVQRLVRCKRSGSAEHELVPVGSSLGDAIRAIHAASAANVFDDYLLTQELRQSWADYPREEIIPAASRESHDHCYWTSGPVLRETRRSCGREHHRSENYSADSHDASSHSHRRTNSADIGFEIVQSFRGRDFSANHLDDGGADRFRSLHDIHLSPQHVREIDIEMCTHSLDGPRICGNLDRG